MDPYRLGLVATRIHYFQLVAQLGSIRQAAQELDVAPSSVSRILRQLEDDLAAPLFERVRQRLKLTQAGEVLLYHARLSLSEFNRACREIGGMNGHAGGSISIAVIESAARCMMPDALEAFWQLHPDVSADVRVMGSQQAAKAVADGDCDLAVVIDVHVPRKVNRLATASLPMGVLALPGSKLAARRELRLVDLAGERVILSDSSLTLGSWIEEAFSRSSIELIHRGRTNSIGLMVDLAGRNLGTVLQTPLGIERETASGTLHFLPLRDSRLGYRKLYLLGRTGGESPAAAALATLLSASIRQLDNAGAG